MTGTAAVPTGGGYWEVGADGGVFSYGAARFFGSMGGERLNQPVFAMAPTRDGRGYWLVARDGGIFTFGNAHYYGSTGGIRLSQPVTGITTSATGHGYRMVARDGGIFTFGDAKFYGSLPGRGMHIGDVVGMATTPTGKGYWIARSNGHVDAFGDAHALGSAAPSTCDPIAAIIGNPTAQGYRLVTTSGATVAFSQAPGGTQPTGATRKCGGISGRIELPSTTMVTGSTMDAYFIVDNETGAPFRAVVADQCQSEWVIGLGNAKIPNPPIVPAVCHLRPLVFPVGQTQFRSTITARSTVSNTPLPPDVYYAQLFFGGFPAVAPVAVHVIPAGP